MGAKPSDLVNGIVKLFGGDQANKLTIGPGNVLNALIALGIGIYLLRGVRRWLDDDLLPKTGMDVGMRASLITLFSNIGYVLCHVFALSAFLMALWRGLIILGIGQSSLLHCGRHGC